MSRSPTNMRTADSLRRRWWVLAKAWHLPQAGSGLVLVSLTVVLLPGVLSLPTLAAGEPRTTPVSAICAWQSAVLALSTAGEPCQAVFVTAPSVTRVVNLVRVVMVLSTGLTVTALADGGQQSWLAVSAGATFLGEGLVSASLLGLRAAWLPPTLHLLAAITLGNVNRVEGLAPWAWFLQPAPPPSVVVGSVCALLLGAAAWRRALGRVRPGG